jgi:hypothetical protein
LTSPSVVPSVSEICAHVKKLGFAASKSIRLYGEDFEVVSDPFPEADGIAVHVITKKDFRIRVLRIPATVLHSAMRRKRPKRLSVANIAIVGQEKASEDKSKDQDQGKGAMEQDEQNRGGNTSMQGQLGHRDEDTELKNADADQSE